MDREPLTVYSRTSLQDEHIIVHLTYGHEHIPDLFQDARRENIWTEIARVSKEAGGVVYWHRDEEGDPYLYIQKLTENRAREIYAAMLADLPTVPTLATLIRKRMRGEGFKVLTSVRGRDGHVTPQVLHEAHGLGLSVRLVDDRHEHQTRTRVFSLRCARNSYPAPVSPSSHASYG